MSYLRTELLIDEFIWTSLDVLLASALVFGAGLVYAGMVRKRCTRYRRAAGLAVATVIILVWMNLAVGLIGSALLFRHAAKHAD